MFANLWKRLRRSVAAPPVKERGGAGERVAATHIEAKGIRILERNWRCSIGELDIIAQEDDHIVFIEVKSAGRETSYRPEDRVNREKQRRIKRLAAAYLRSRHWDKPVRYDIVTVIWDQEKPKIEHFENAFS